MKKIILYAALTVVVSLIVNGCERDKLPIIDPYPVEIFEPASPQKSNDMKLYVHYMPWFETPETNGGAWGQHWTMANKNPNNMDENGKREIAAHYYPLIGPYASGDKDALEYHLLLMKYSGIDGLLVDWYGTRDLYDYPAVKRNTEVLMDVAGKVGLELAIVYEDQTLRAEMEGTDEKMAQAQADMKYLEANFFNKSNYIKVDGKPLLLVFGPQEISSPDNWSTILSVLNTKPSFLALYGHSGATNSAATKNAQGEYIWVDATSMDTKYAAKDNFELFMGGAYPGFHDFYKEGGWGESVLSSIDYADGATFRNLLNMAKSNHVDMLQLITWNDFGEGTMIEPTEEFGYSFLSELQTFSGISYNTPVLEDIYKYYVLKKQYPNNLKVQSALSQAFYYFISLQQDKARSILDEYKVN